MLPLVNVKTTDGKTIKTEKFRNNGKLVFLCFWATWCGPCKKELNALSEVYDDWIKETGVKIIAVSIDDSRSSSKVPSIVSGNGWEFEIYLDENSDLKRAMNVNMPPHAFILNDKGEILWEHVGFKEGDEDQYLQAIKRFSSAGR
ncbi:MAG: TlpA family protein disulfide reductase [Bacteroidetes bacterium]|nr:TlpA family protein disulfide reductase [Bacteroidota bacterium]